MNQHRLRVLVLPEDGGADGFATVKTIVRGTLEYIEPGCPLWQDEGSEHAWVDPKTQEALGMVHAAAWKVRVPKDPAFITQKRDFKRAVVSHLLLHETFEGERKPIGFVFFHHDGDAPWSTHPSCTLCEQFREFLVELEQNVKAAVDRDKRFASEDANAVTRRALSRLFPVEPHPSIEAWLLGKSARARSLCREHHDGAHDGPDAWWEIPRARIEERSNPKSSCLQAKHNAALARVFDVEAAYGESPSFTALVDSALGCQDLCEALSDLATSITST